MRGTIGDNLRKTGIPKEENKTKEVKKLNTNTAEYI